MTGSCLCWKKPRFNKSSANFSANMCILVISLMSCCFWVGWFVFFSTSLLLHSVVLSMQLLNEQQHCCHDLLTTCKQCLSIQNFVCLRTVRWHQSCVLLRTCLHKAQSCPHWHLNQSHWFDVQFLEADFSSWRLIWSIVFIAPMSLLCPLFV